MVGFVFVAVKEQNELFSPEHYDSGIRGGGGISVLLLTRERSECG